jgi:hypothetical protein
MVAISCLRAASSFFIEPPFLGRCGSCGNQAKGLDLILVPNCEYDKQDRARRDLSKCVVSFFGLVV